jgi:hypothetical protein
MSPTAGFRQTFSSMARVAVEVRRLNQHYEMDGRSRGLERNLPPSSQNSDV